MSPVKLVYGLNYGCPVLHDALYNDESHTEYDQGNSNNNIIIKVFIEPIVKKNTDNCCRNASKSDLEPHNDLILHYVSADALI